jgi:hypothetical protein
MTAALAACPAAAQSLAGLHIGDPAARLKPLGDSAHAAPDGDYLNQKWTLADGNDLAVTTSPDGSIVFLEDDAGGKDADPGCDLPGLKFGVTTLADLRKRFGSGGFGFHNRSAILEIDGGGAVMMNSYQIGDVIATFITKLSAEDYAPFKEAPDVAKLAVHARLDAVMLSDAKYALREWGPRIYDPDYKKIQWK